MIIKTLKTISFFLFLFSINAIAQGYGVNLNKTRVILDSSKKSVSIKVNNTEHDKKWLIRAWVTNYKDEVKTNKFFITPPLYYIQPKESIQLRIENVIKDLPTDRESIFRVNVLTIPEKENNSAGDSGVLQLAVNHRVKLIYRPNGINDNDKIKLAYSNINVKKSKQGVSIKNTSPYHITLDKVKINNRDVKLITDFMVEPYGELLVPDIKARDFSYKIINDYGVRTPEIKVHF